MNNMTVLVEKILGNDIRTRARIHDLINVMNDATDCDLDFTGVTFISRSFADELISMSEAGSRNIRIVNANDEINTLLHIVKKGRNIKGGHSQEGDIRVLKTMKDVEMFFNAI